eukprot:7291011-Alexandrium_andersonii.AAC.1
MHRPISLRAAPGALRATSDDSRDPRHGAAVEQYAPWSSERYSVRSVRFPSPSVPSIDSVRSIFT